MPETLLCCSAIFCCWFRMLISLELVAGITESAKFSFPDIDVEEVTAESSLVIFFGGVGGLHFSSDSSTTNVESPSFVESPGVFVSCFQGGILEL